MLKIIGPRKCLFNHRITRITRLHGSHHHHHHHHHNPESEEKQGPESSDANNSRIKVECSNGAVKYYNRVIVTLPTAACANIDWEGFPDFKNHYDAFRNLNADPLFKHSLEFNHRFWEDPEIMQDYFAFIGGQVVSNLSSRNLVFPCYGYRDIPKQSDLDKEEKPGTVLCYNFYQDGMRFIGLSEAERTQRVLSDLNTVFKKLVKSPDTFDSRKYYTGNSYSQSWANTNGNGLAFFRPH